MAYAGCWLLAAGATVASGVSFGNIFPTPKQRQKVMLILGEDQAEDYAWRMQAMMESPFGQSYPWLDMDLKIEVLEGRRFPLVVRSGGGVVESGCLEVLEKMTRGCKLVGIDPVIMFSDADEGKNNELDVFARALAAVAIRNKLGFLMAQHASQDAILNKRDDNHAGRGGTALAAATRGGWVIRGLNDKEVKAANIPEQQLAEWKVLVNAKASHKSIDKKVWLKHEKDGVLVQKWPPGIIKSAPETGYKKNTRSENKKTVNGVEYGDVPF
ncbi:hypothetical protein THIX_60975 [Thiomonas sp. X19]|uniref:AAA family ATPase n=1 Tax=Thiomonas sp. X19 TaxID=1050370 RepID=UPI000B65A8D7|nr:AAA family ATPase [Thiomonas sp. X19]SCC94917.1 hypothetical protein THIX_60975 [Thiomonas sp. X19]